MEGIDTEPISLNETVAEIAIILARGYLRCRKGRSLGDDTSEEAVFTDKGEES